MAMSAELRVRLTKSGMYCINAAILFQWPIFASSKQEFQIFNNVLWREEGEVNFPRLIIQSASPLIITLMG